MKYNKINIEASIEEADKISRTLSWVKIACHMSKDEEKTIDQFLYKIRVAKKSLGRS